MESNNKFSDEELENVLYSSKIHIIHRLANKMKNLIGDYPLQTMGLTLAFGLLVGAAFSNSRKK